MNIILDTHVFIWWNDDPAKLSKAAHKAIEDKENTIYISAVVIWEIVVKVMLGKLEAPDDPLSYENYTLLTQDKIVLKYKGFKSIKV